MPVFFLFPALLFCSREGAGRARRHRSFRFHHNRIFFSCPVYGSVLFEIQVFGRCVSFFPLCGVDLSSTVCGQHHVFSLDKVESQAGGEVLCESVRFSIFVDDIVLVGSCRVLQIWGGGEIVGDSGRHIYSGGIFVVQIGNPF